MNQKSFNLKSLKVSYNKKVDINHIYDKIHRKFSLQEIMQYAFVGYYKSKKNIVLVVLSNEKIFIDDEKDKVPYVGVYTYKEILKLNYQESLKNDLKSCIELKTASDVIKIKGVSRPIFQEIVKNFNEQKDKYMKFFPEKILTGMREQHITDDDDIVSEETPVEQLVPIEQSKEETLINTRVDEDLMAYQDQKLKDIYEFENKPAETKSKKVVNDEIISKINTYSSAYLSSLFLADDQILPNGQKTLFYELSKKLNYLESTSFSLNSIDATPIKLEKKALKLNTVPIIAELEPLVQKEEKDQYETRFLFTRNWIEYTKHNVSNKVLGVDANGNGAYLDISKVSSSHTIDIYKAKEYKINDEIRSGLRSSQTISAYEKNGRPGIDSLYYNKTTKKKLDIKQYDGIIFLGVKYYFGAYYEFSKLQREYTRIFAEEKRSSGEIYRRYELIFEDDLITYKAYNEKGVLIDDLYSNSSSYDLKWLTFFKD